jgi:hypothetical protein
MRIRGIMGINGLGIEGGFSVGKNSGVGYSPVITLKAE